MPEMPLVAVVDDDSSFRDATQNLLEASGFSTETFASAESFLASKRRHDVSCLVTDMRMPAMTGLELCLERRLRQSYSGRLIRRILRVGPLARAESGCPL